MSFNSYTPTSRQWDHVGNLVPNFEHSEGIRPHFNSIPAPWLPVVFQDKHYENWIVVAAGKAVGLTREGDVCPAGLRVSWAAAAGGDTVLTYTANDVTEQVIDLTTGAVVSAATSYTLTQVQTALRSRGLIGSAETPDAFVSMPVGVAAQSYYVWASTSRDGFKPADLKFHNFRMQHQVAVLCDYVIRVPHLASASTDETLDAALTGSTLTYGAGNLFSAANVIATVRYSGVTSTDFIAASLTNSALAKSTARTTISADDSTLLLRERTSVDGMSQSGDYYLDYEAGVAFFWVSGGATVPARVSGTVLSYNHYNSVPTSVHDYVAATGLLRPGSLVEVDGDSNFTLATGTGINTVMGQVLGFITHPRDNLDKVKTHYSSLGTVNQMPGTATSGFPDTLNVSTTGADREVIINLISR